MQVKGLIKLIKKQSLSPHIAANTVEAQINCAVTAAEQIIAFFHEGKILNRVI